MSFPEPQPSPAIAIRRDPTEQKQHTGANIAGAFVALGLLWMWADAALPQLEILLPKAKWLPIAVAALGKVYEVWHRYQVTGKIEIVSYAPSDSPFIAARPASAPPGMLLREESEADTQSDPFGGDIAKNDG